LKLYQYRIYELIIQSELELPDLLEDYSSQADVVIKYGEVPSELTNPKSQGVLYEANREEFIFRFPKIGSFSVKRGSEIIIQPADSANPSEIRVFLLGSVMGALLHQREIFPIHGSTINTSKGAVIISGRSCTGKSTLAAAFYKAGFEVIADDVSVIKSNFDGGFIVVPGIPYLKLWKDSLDELGINGKLERVRDDIEKYKLPLSGVSPLKSHVVKKVIILSIKNSSGIQHCEIRGSEKFAILRNNSYRAQFIYGLDQTESHFEMLSNLSRTIKLIRVERPSSPFLIDDLLHYIIEKII